MLFLRTFFSFPSKHTCRIAEKQVIRGKNPAPSGQIRLLCPITREPHCPRFANYIARAKEIEAHRIAQYALINKLNSGMAQWVLAVHHNQHNVQKSEVTGRDGAPLEAPNITIMPVAVKKDKDEEE